MICDYSFNSRFEALENIFVAFDFEKAMYNALKAHFVGVEIVGCKFHLIKAVYSYIRRKVADDHIFKQQLRAKEEMKTDLMKLASICCTKEEFYSLKAKFIAKWRTLAGEKFITYLIKYYLGDEATSPTFAPHDWAMAMRSRWHVLDQTNNQAELFHHHFNERFSERPQ